MAFFDRFFKPVPTAYDGTGPIFMIADGSAPALTQVLGALRAVQAGDCTAPDLHDRIAAVRPAVIVIEIELTGTNGFLVIKRIKSDARLRAIPTAVFSYLATEETFEQHKKLRSRADRYVLGTDPQAIAAAVAQLL